MQTRCLALWCLALWARCVSGSASPPLDASSPQHLCSLNVSGGLGDVDGIYHSAGITSNGRRYFVRTPTCTESCPLDCTTRYIYYDTNCAGQQKPGWILSQGVYGTGVHFFDASRADNFFVKPNQATIELCGLACGTHVCCESANFHTTNQRLPTRLQMTNSSSGASPLTVTLIAGEGDAESCDDPSFVPPSSSPAPLPQPSPPPSPPMVPPPPAPPFSPPPSSPPPSYPSAPKLLAKHFLLLLGVVVFLAVISAIIASCIRRQWAAADAPIDSPAPPADELASRMLEPAPAGVSLEQASARGYDMRRILGLEEAPRGPRGAPEGAGVSDRVSEYVGSAVVRLVPRVASLEKL